MPFLSLLMTKTGGIVAAALVALLLLGGFLVHYHNLQTENAKLTQTVQTAKAINTALTTAQVATAAAVDQQKADETNLAVAQTNIQEEIDAQPSSKAVPSSRVLAAVHGVSGLRH